MIVKAMAYFIIVAIMFANMVHAATNERGFSETIERDIAILGAGASGTYAAVRLREDYKQSIVVIEKDGLIGGHVHTYIDPETSMPIDYGVLQYWDYGPSRDFFARMHVETVPATQGTNTVAYLDHETARNLSSYISPALPEVLKSVEVYGNESEKYSDILLPGYWNFPSGDQIPLDLLLPFGEFANKYHIETLYPLMQVIAGIGVGGVRDIPTLYAMGFAFGLPACEGVIKESSFLPKSGSNSELYEKAYAMLKNDILLNSSVVQAFRSNMGVQLVVRNADGTTTLIKAKKLLVTAAPSITNLALLDLDDQEFAVFSSATLRPTHVGIIKTSVIPRNFSVEYISSAAAPDNYLDLYKDLPYDLKFQSTGPEGSQLFRVLLETNYTISAEGAKSLIQNRLEALRSAGTFDTDDGSASGGCHLEFKAFADHSSILWRVPADWLRNGFIQNMFALQGYRATWYTGSLWATDFSSNVWAFTDTVLERMMR